MQGPSDEEIIDDDVELEKNGPDGGPGEGARGFAVGEDRRPEVEDLRPELMEEAPGGQALEQPAGGREGRRG